LKKYAFTNKKYWAEGKDSIKLIQEKLESKGITLSKDFATILVKRKEAEKKTSTKRTKSKMDLTPLVNAFRKKMGKKPLEKREIAKVTISVPPFKNYLDSYTCDL